MKGWGGGTQVRGGYPPRYMKPCIYIYICVCVMMKPPFKASDSAINVLRAPWFDLCTVWFVASLSCINEVMKYICYVMPTRAISGL